MAQVLFYNSPLEGTSFRSSGLPWSWPTAAMT